MATDTITAPTPARFAAVLAELIDADATADVYPKGYEAPTTFADLHRHTDANEYLQEAAEALGFDLFDGYEGTMSDAMLTLCNTAMALVSAVMTKPCDACGHALGPFAPRVTDEGTFHGLVCPGDAHRVR
jgi:hypothetical protein